MAFLMDDWFLTLLQHLLQLKLMPWRAWVANIFKLVRMALRKSVELHQARC